MRTFVPILAAVFLGCASSSGAHPLELVRQETTALRGRTWIDVEHGLVFPHCPARPNTGYLCGVIATREAEREAEAACAGQPSSCRRERLGALYAQIQERAERLDVNVLAVTSRCGPPCRDLKNLELEIVRTAGRLTEQRARAALLRADDSERDALERENKDTKPFVRQKNERDQRLATIFGKFWHDVDDAAREGASWPHATACAQTQECDDGAECNHFRDAPLGLCEKP